jgi:TonB family protein
MVVQTERVTRRKFSADSADAFMKALVYSAGLHVTVIIAAIIVSSFATAWKPPIDLMKPYAVHLIDPGPPSTATASIAKDKTKRKTDKFEPPTKKEASAKQITTVKKSKKETKKTEFKAREKTVKQVKKVDEAPANVVNKQKTGGTIDIKKFPYEWYLRMIETKIYGNWDTLGVNSVSGESVKVTIYFQIGKNGKLKGSKVESSSQNESIDESALKAVNMSGPFPPLPDGYKEDQLEVHFGFKIDPR